MPPSAGFPMCMVHEFSGVHSKAQRLYSWSQIVLSRDEKTLLSSWEGIVCSSSRQKAVIASKKSKEV